MTKYPKRTGFKLTPLFECVYNDWKRKQEKEMSRSDIKDKGSTKTSPWFGFKYRVNLESSKLLQEAVFADGGGWYNGNDKIILHLSEKYLLVNKQGCLTYTTEEDVFDSKGFPEKQPPQPKEFKVGKWYKCIDEGSLPQPSRLTKDKWFQVIRISSAGGLEVASDVGRYYNLHRFDVNSESDNDPNEIKPLQDEKDSIKWPTQDKSYQDEKTSLQYHQHKQFIPPAITGYALCGEQDLKFYDTTGVPKEYTGVDLTKFIINQQEEVNMSTNNYRKTVTVNLIDRDSALDEKFALVATFGEFTTSKSSEALIRSIIIDPKNKVAELIAQHNEVRTKQINKEVLERTGNKVTLEPVEESDLHWEIR